MSFPLDDDEPDYPDYSDDEPYIPPPQPPPPVGCLIVGFVLYVIIAIVCTYTGMCGR